MNNLFLLLSLVAAAEWTPISEFADTNGSQIRITSSNNPRYTYNETGKLIPIDPYQEELEWVGDQQYYRRTAMPISAGLLKYATHEGIEWLSSARDWGTDRGIEWTLWDVKWHGERSMPEVATPQWVDEKLQEAGEYSVWNSPTTVRRAVAIPDILDSTDFVVTYRFRLHDLRIANEINSASEFIPDPTTGYFTVTTMGGDGRFEIRLPKLLDADWNVLPGNLRHRMRLIESDLVEYEKYPGGSLTVEQLQKSALLDAETTVYGSSLDGWINVTSGSYAASQTATTGTNMNLNGQYVSQGVAFLKTSWELLRTVLVFVTSFLTSSDMARITGLQLKLYPYGAYTCDVSVFQGTWTGTPALADFDSYGSELVSRQGWSSAGWNTFNLYSQRYNAITPGGNTRFMLREWVHDVDTEAPTDDTAAAGLRYSEYTDSTYDPVLIIDLSPQHNTAYYYINQ